jgi:hypothetical protein
MENKYYEEFPQELFEELKSLCIDMWKIIHTDYAESKVLQLQSIDNIRDNGMYMLSMFDLGNLMALRLKMSEELKIEVKERLESVGSKLTFLFN